MMEEAAQSTTEGESSNGNRSSNSVSASAAAASASASAVHNSINMPVSTSSANGNQSNYAPATNDELPEIPLRTRTCDLNLASVASFETLVKVKPLFLKLLWKSGPIPCKGKKDLTRYKFLLSDEVGHIQAICFNEHGQNLNQRLEVGKVYQIHKGTLAKDDYPEFSLSEKDFLIKVPYANSIRERIPQPTSHGMINYIPFSFIPFSAIWNSVEEGQIVDLIGIVSKVHTKTKCKKEIILKDSAAKSGSIPLTVTLWGETVKLITKKGTIVCIKNAKVGQEYYGQQSINVSEACCLVKIEPGNSAEMQLLSQRDREEFYNKLFPVLTPTKRTNGVTGLHTPEKRLRTNSRPQGSPKILDFGECTLNEIKEFKNSKRRKPLERLVRNVTFTGKGYVSKYDGCPVCRKKCVVYEGDQPFKCLSFKCKNNSELRMPDKLVVINNIGLSDRLTILDGFTYFGPLFRTPFLDVEYGNPNSDARIRVDGRNFDVTLKMEKENNQWNVIITKCEMAVPVPAGNIEIPILTEQ